MSNIQKHLQERNNPVCLELRSLQHSTIGGGSLPPSPRILPLLAALKPRDSAFWALPMWCLGTEAGEPIPPYRMRIQVPSRRSLCRVCIESTQCKPYTKTSSRGLAYETGGLAPLLQYAQSPHTTCLITGNIRNNKVFYLVPCHFSIHIRAAIRAMAARLTQSDTVPSDHELSTRNRRTRKTNSGTYVGWLEFNIPLRYISK